MSYLVALDQGTTSSRAMVFNAEGEIVSRAQKEFAQYFPQPGWVEHDAREIWSSVLECLHAALRQGGIAARDIAGIGITNQRETTVLWDRKSGEPVAPAIVWQDRRTAARCDALKAAGHEAWVSERTGLLLDPYFSGTKLAWLLDHVPGARARAEAGELAFGTIDSWLLWQLTGGAVHATDVSNASRTLLFNLDRQAWDDELLELFGVPANVLPELRASSADFGRCDEKILGAPVLIGGLAGDQQAALFGQACHARGMAKNTYGTGCFLLLQTGEKRPRAGHGLLTTAAAQVDTTPRFALEGSVFIGGAVVQWLRDGLKLIQQASEIESLARSVPDSGGVVFVPAFAGLGSPHWDPYARGGLFGLHRGSTAAHIARAALEAIAFQSAEVLRAMENDAGEPITELRVDGGAAANDLLLQMQADLLGVPVLRPQVLETTALGAAYLAGLQASVWHSVEEISAHWRCAKRFEPAMSADEREARMRRWLRAVERVKAWAVDEETKGE